MSKPLFRAVKLPEDASGSLYLHSMPGYKEPLKDSLDEITWRLVDRVVCLAHPAEVAHYSPTYARALADGAVPCEVTSFPIVDMGTPVSREEYLKLAQGIANELRGGKNILIHCAYGIGRTGTLCASVLALLGYSLNDAIRFTALAGSKPEVSAQQGLIAWVAGQPRALP
ncbi:MAG: protein-tyrosine phosphatase family protein [Anaerolineae bacterium]